MKTANGTEQIILEEELLSNKYKTLTNNMNRETNRQAVQIVLMFMAFTLFCFQTEIIFNINLQTTVTHKAN